MESNDFSYLDLGDKLQNYVVQSSDETFGLQYHHSLNVEPIFAEVDCNDGTWTQYELPILMNGPLISEQPTSPLLPPQQEHLYTEIQDSQTEEPSEELVEDNDVDTSVSYPVDVPNTGLITNGLIVANDVLLQINQSNSVATDIETNDTNQIGVATTLQGNQEQYIITGDKIKTTSAKIATSADVIHLLNIGGPLLNISHSNNSSNKIGISSNTTKRDGVSNTKSRNGKHLLNLDEYFKKIMAHKCLKCNFVCEERSDMLKHISNMHLITIEKQQNGNGLPKKMNSVLISKQNKPNIANNVKISKTQNGINNINNNNNNENPQDHEENCKTIYLCSECSLGYHNVESLKNHMIAKHKLITLSDVQVDLTEQPEKESTISTEIPETLSPGVEPPNDNADQKLKNLKIIKKQNTCKKIKCSVKGCEARFSKDEYRLRHEKCHVDGQKNKYKCTICEKTFTIWRVCSLHLWKCHNIDSGLLTCPICFSYKTMAPYKLLNHMQIHGNANTFLCNVCGKSFKQASQLRNHYVIHNTEDVPAWAAQQKCDVCGNFFANSKSLKKHIQSVHNKFKPFICNICGHKTARKAMLDLHLRQHTGEKPHKCTNCEYRTGDHNSFRRHMMRHSGAIQYSCPHCDYQSIQSIAYKNHLANKHPGLEGIYTCLLCAYNTVNEAAYHNHVKAHESKMKQNDVDNDVAANSSTATSTLTHAKMKNDLINLEPLERMLNGDDEETQNCFLTATDKEEIVDTGGITIPADLEMQV